MFKLGKSYTYFEQKKESISFSLIPRFWVSSKLFVKMEKKAECGLVSTGRIRNIGVENFENEKIS